MKRIHAGNAKIQYLKIFVVFIRSEKYPDEK